MKKYMVLVAAMMMIAGMVSAQEVEGFESAEIADTLIANVDTVEVDPDPEWYVAPLNYDSVMARHNAPRRAAAANCPVDSVRTFNVDSILTDVVIYEYGDTTRTVTWAINPDGSRVGVSKEEEGNINGIQFSATYEWDNSTNDWRGIYKEEHMYEGGSETVRILYNTWQNNTWVADTKYTWVYDATGRETEYTTYTRNTSSNELILSQQRLREYNAVGKTTLDIQYTAHNGTTWSAGTKKEYDYDNAGNQIEYTYYSSLSNGNWVRSTREIWTYTSGKKTLYEKYTWSNGNWVGSTKEIWTFNASGKQILYEKFGWSNGDWAISLQENAGYDNAGNNTLVENYTITSGTWKGSKKEEYTYNSANKKTGTITYKWSNSAWVKNVWTVTDYDAAGNTIESCKYNWKNEAWVGTGTRTLQTYNSNKKVTEKITQSWSTALNDWLNKTRNTTQYSGSKTTQEASYKWSADANDWVGTSRSDWHYNAAGLNDTIKTYTPDGTGWLYSGRTVNTYNAEGTNIMTHNAKWQDNAWVLVSMARVDIIKDAEGHQLLNASWHCYADSVWVGETKDTAAYNAHGKAIYTARYTSWANNDWVPSYKQRFEYDEADRILLNERYNWSSNKWQGAFRYEYGYDEQGRQNYSATYNSYNSSTDSWVGTTMTMTVFNELGQTVMSTLHNWQNSDWNAFYKYLYTYDTEGHLVEQVVQSYSNNEWQNALRYEKGYHNDVLVVSNDYTWRDNAWHLTSKSEKKYDEDAEAKLRREIIGQWNSSTGASISYTDNLYFYDCDFPYYTIRFENYDGSLLQSSEVKETKKPVYEGAKPSRPADAQYTYTFKGWTPAIVAVTGDATYTADYDSIVNRYRITWLDADDTEIAADSLDYGATPSHEDLVKTNTVEWTYSFVGWTPAITSVTADATYKAQFDSVRNSYRITWLDVDDTEIAVDSLEYGSMPSREYVLKANTAEWTYSFVGWTPEIAAITGDATYKAQIDSVRNRYRITWLDADDTEIAVDSLVYGATPSREYVLKANTAEWTYSFVGWTPEIVAVTGDATYKAQLDSVINTYLVTFKNGQETLQSTQVAYGSMPEYTGNEPTKQADAQYTYSFNGWDAELVSVTGEATYNATFSSTINNYRITFKNGVDTLQSTLVAYGTMPVYGGETPTKQADVQYSYTFNGWDAELVAVNGETTYNATFSSTVNSYTITWLLDDGTKIDEQQLAYGATPTHADAHKDNTAQYTITFVGWDKAFAAVTGDETYTAVFDSVVNRYTVIFYFEDGITVLDSKEFEYGEMPSTSLIPSLPATPKYTYTFAGWSPELQPVTGNATYTPVFDSIVNTYTVTFVNYNNMVLQSSQVPYDDVPEYTGETPTKPSSYKYHYVFTGWTPELVAVTGDARYKAEYEQVLNSYTILFYDEDGITVLDSVEVYHGEMPETSVIPTKEDDEEYTYTFAGWSPKIVSATKNTSYTATYTATRKTEGLWDVEAAEKAQKVMIDGVIYIRRGGKIYTLDGTEVE